MKQRLLDRFIESHPDFRSELEQLSDKNREKFIRNFKVESQEENFLSTLSEFRFAQFLERELVDYEYEPTIGQKKPDFVFKLTNNELVYFDVKRFNVSDFDKRNDKILYELAELLKTIKKPYYLHIEQIKKELSFDLQSTFLGVEKWILQNDLREGNSYNYKDMFRIEISKTNGIKNHVLYSYRGKNPTIHANKPVSDILSKIRTYQKVIIDYGFPFFVGIDLTIDTLKDPLDYWIQFCGASCIDIDTEIESFQLGEFYTNPELDGLTGLMIRFNNQFYWLKNPRSTKQLEFQNIKTKYK
jgi:hypothetical protein